MYKTVEKPKVSFLNDIQFGDVFKADVVPDPGSV